MSAVSSFAYVGSELELFARATNWKNYFAARVRPHLGAEVLEVGAGFGGTTKILCTGSHQRWVCLEPDPQLTGTLQTAVANGELPACCQGKVGTLADLDATDCYDAILYMDVLEHIEDDRAEMERAAAHVKPGGKVIVLAPAHQWLFSPFDQSIGHFRRYTKQRMRDVTPAALRLVDPRDFDSIGLLASAGNRFILGSGMPNQRQIWIWDKLMVPLSRLVDPLLFGALGKSLLGVWRLG